jgi:hypothetical protein
MISAAALSDCGGTPPVLKVPRRSLRKQNKSAAALAARFSENLSVF